MMGCSCKTGGTWSENEHVVGTFWSLGMATIWMGAIMVPFSVENIPMSLCHLMASILGIAFLDDMRRTHRWKPS